MDMLVNLGSVVHVAHYRQHARFKIPQLTTLTDPGGGRNTNALSAEVA